MQIEVDDDVKQMVLNEKHDFRVCTACLGPALVSTEVKSPKPTDLKVPVGEYTIYVSKVQAPYIGRITMDMLYDEDEIDSCPAFYSYSSRRRFARTFSNRQCSGLRVVNPRPPACSFKYLCLPVISLWIILCQMLSYGLGDFCSCRS